tara:strand:- start:593 stop:814 length:222 start_codon:yes stop_codon:yes gene_type:complete
MTGCIRESITNNNRIKGVVVDIFQKNRLKVLLNCFRYENFFLLGDNYFSLDQVIEILKKEYNYTDKQIEKLRG